MAVTFAQVTNGQGDDSDVTGSVTVTNSVTMTAGARVYVVVLHGKGSGIAAVSSIAGASISGCAASSGAAMSFDTTATPQKRLELWKGTATGSAGALTITFPSSRVFCCYKIIEVSGDSGGARVQAVAASGEAAQTATATLAAYASATNGVLFAVGRDGSGDAVTGEAGWTELGTAVSDASPIANLTCFWRAAVDTTPSATWPTYFYDWGVVGIEVPEAAAAGGWLPQAVVG